MLTDVVPTKSPAWCFYFRGHELYKVYIKPAVLECFENDIFFNQ